MSDLYDYDLGAPSRPQSSRTMGLGQTLTFQGTVRANRIKCHVRWERRRRKAKWAKLIWDHEIPIAILSFLNIQFSLHNVIILLDSLFHQIMFAIPCENGWSQSRKRTIPGLWWQMQGKCGCQRVYWRLPSMLRSDLLVNDRCMLLMVWW